MNGFKNLIKQRTSSIMRHIRMALDLEFYPFFKKLPDGWFRYDRCRTLYDEAMKTPGPILEIGSFIGRSTACIAYALKQRGMKNAFYATDFHFESAESFQEWYEKIYHKRIDLPDLFIKYMKEGGTFYHLRKNLDDLGLLSYVETLKGNFTEVAPVQKYPLIFCDATHNIDEIRISIPQIKKFAKSGTVLLCDDIRTQEMYQEMLKQMHFRTSEIINDSLFKGVVDIDY